MRCFIFPLSFENDNYVQCCIFPLSFENEFDCFIFPLSFENEFDCVAFFHCHLRMNLTELHFSIVI